MNNEKKIIAIDLDGTLLTDKKTIRISTILYLKKQEKLGNIIVITTGRPARTAIKFYNTLNLHGPMLSYNGNYIYNPRDVTFVPMITTIKKEFVKEIYKTLIGKHADCAFTESLNELCYDKKDFFVFTIDENNHIENKIGRLDENLDKDPLIFIMHVSDSSKENCDYITNYVNEKFPTLIAEFWGQNDYVEIHNRGINKGSQIKKLMNFYQVKPNNVYTFGDSINDIDMVTTFKNGFAMKNANKKLLELTKNITIDDNNHNGVIKTLNKYFKNPNK